MLKTEQKSTEETTTKTPQTIDEKIVKARERYEDLVITKSEKETKSENHQILLSVSKKAVKAFETGKDVDWNLFGNDLALFSRIQNPTAEETLKVLQKLAVIYLGKEKERREEEEKSKSSNKKEPDEIPEDEP